MFLTPLSRAGFKDFHGVILLEGKEIQGTIFAVQGMLVKFTEP